MGEWAGVRAQGGTSISDNVYSIRYFFFRHAIQRTPEQAVEQDDRQHHAEGGGQQEVVSAGGGLRDE